MLYDYVQLDLDSIKSQSIITDSPSTKSLRKRSQQKKKHHHTKPRTWVPIADFKEYVFYTSKGVCVCALEDTSRQVLIHILAMHTGSSWCFVNIWYVAASKSLIAPCKLVFGMTWHVAAPLLGCMWLTDDGQEYPPIANNNEWPGALLMIDRLWQLVSEKKVYTKTATGLLQ